MALYSCWVGNKTVPQGLGDSFEMDVVAVVTARLAETTVVCVGLRGEALRMAAGRLVGGGQLWTKCTTF